MTTTRGLRLRRRGAPDPAPTCLAPATAMHFSLAGDVHACCQNGEYAYGNVNEATLAEIWHGQARRAMADDLADGRYPVGCDLCKVEHALGNRDSTPAQAFDVFEDGPREWPRQLEFTMSNRCNLACIQCNGDNSSTIRAKREGRPPLPMPYTDSFFEQLPPFLEEAEIVSFLGGEPFLAPEAKRVWDLLRECRSTPQVRVTTNATVWSDALERYVYDLEMHLAVSIDGATKPTYEAIREGANHDRMIEIRDRMLTATRSYGGVFHLNYCLLRANWHEVGAFLLQADELDVDANIIPVFGPPDHSLFTLPERDLAPIVEQLHAEDRRLAERLGRNRGEWETVLRVLRDQVARPGANVSRETALTGIRSRRELAERVEAERVEREAREAAERERLEAERLAREEELRAYRLDRSTELVGRAEEDLRAWAGQECIELTIEDDLVCTVQVPAWAEPMGAAGWVGADIATIGERVAAQLGKVDFDVQDDLSDGERLVVVNDSVLTSAGGPLRFRALYAPHLGRMLIASPDRLGQPSAEGDALI